MYIHAQGSYVQVYGSYIQVKGSYIQAGIRILHLYTRVMHPYTRIIHPCTRIIHPCTRIMHPGTTTMHPSIGTRITYPCTHKNTGTWIIFLGLHIQHHGSQSRYMDHDMGSDLYYAGSVAELVTARWLEHCDHLDVKPTSPCPACTGQYVPKTVQSDKN